MRTRVWPWRLGITLVSALVFSGSGNAETVCNTYENSKVALFDSYGPACYDTGPGCHECVTTATRGVKVCYWIDFNDIYCYYSGQYPDNQL